MKDQELKKKKLSLFLKIMFLTSTRNVIAGGNGMKLLFFSLTVGVGLVISAIANSLLTPLTVNAQTKLHSVPEITWNTRLSSFDFDNRDQGRIFTFNCPAALSAQVYAPVWGTDLYTINSGLCSAAVHAGMITTEGGLINVELNAEASDYDGSDRFGVVSHSYDREIPSLRFIGKPVAFETDEEPHNEATQNESRRRPSSIERTVGNGVRRGIERTISDSIRDIFR